MKIVLVEDSLIVRSPVVGESVKVTKLIFVHNY